MKKMPAFLTVGIKVKDNSGDLVLNIEDQTGVVILIPLDWDERDDEERAKYLIKKQDHIFDAVLGELSFNQFEAFRIKAIAGEIQEIELKVINVASNYPGRRFEREVYDTIVTIA